MCAHKTVMRCTTDVVADVCPAVARCDSHPRAGRRLRTEGHIALCSSDKNELDFE